MMGEAKPPQTSTQKYKLNKTKGGLEKRQSNIQKHHREIKQQAKRTNKVAQYFQNLR